MIKRTLTLPQRVAIAMMAGFVIGVMWLVAVRFAVYKNTDPHYHANFAIYVGGQRDELDNFTFYEEVQSCSSDELNNPRARVHMHDQVNHVAHVHDKAATWGQLFANLGYTLGDNLLKNDQGVYVDNNEDNQLSFWLNGQEVDGIVNRTINSEDTLLINYGKDNEAVLQQRYAEIVQDATEYNMRDDPSSCSGSKSVSFSERLKASIGLD